MHKPNTYLRIRFSQVNRRNYFQRSKKKKRKKGKQGIGDETQ